MQFRLEFQYTYEEFLEAQRAHMKADAKRARTGAGLLGWVIFIGLAVMFFLILQGRQSPSAPAAPTTAPTPSSPLSDMLFSCAPWLIVILFVVIVAIRVARRQWKRIWDGSPHLQQPRVITADEQMLTDATTLSSHAYRWPGFAKYHEAPNLFVLYPSQFMMIIVPKRAFASPAEADAFRAFIAQRITPPQQAFPVLPPKP